MKVYQLFLVLALGLSVSGCDAAKKEVIYPPRDNVFLSDLINHNKDKEALIKELNPKEEYAIDVVVHQTPLRERDSLKSMTMGHLIKMYEKQTDKTVPMGKVKADDLKYKELITQSGKNLYVMSYSQEDRDMMMKYVAKKLFKAEEMAVVRNKTVKELMDDAKKEK